MKINDIINETRKNPELNTKENAYDFLLNEAPVPKPLDNDIEDAIEHADTEGNGWDRTDFHLEYEGYMPVDDISQYDDIDGWLEVHDEEDLEDFRDGKFMNLENEPAPIIVVVYPDEGGCHEEIGDGRGRVNYANATGTRLHVYKLTHKSCM